MNTSSTDTLRAFIAARPNEAAHAELVRVQRELKKSLAESELRIKWTDPETFHITLLFLGDIPSRDVDRIFQCLENTEVEPVSFKISSIELVKSELLPEGPRHTVLREVSLRG